MTKTKKWRLLKWLSSQNKPTKRKLYDQKKRKTKKTQTSKSNLTQKIEKKHTDKACMPFS